MYAIERGQLPHLGLEGGTLHVQIGSGEHQGTYRGITGTIIIGPEDTVIKAFDVEKEQTSGEWEPTTDLNGFFKFDSSVRVERAGSGSYVRISSRDGRSSAYLHKPERS